MGRPEDEGEEGSNGNGNSNGKRKVSGESDVPIKSEIKQEPEEGESTVMQ
jgi:DASH complex subunit DAD1